MESTFKCWLFGTIGALIAFGLEFPLILLFVGPPMPDWLVWACLPVAAMIPVAGMGVGYHVYLRRYYDTGLFGD